MHYFQQKYLEYQRAFSSLTSGLDTVDLPNKGLLSGIEIRVQGQNGTGTGAEQDVWVHDRLKKVEVIVNGSQVVKSLSGNQILADMLYKKTELASHNMKNLPDGSGQEMFYINLGRYYHDLEYMLDLGQVNDPELRFDYDFGMTSVDGFTNGVAMAVTPSMTIIPHILRDPAAMPKGYIKTSEIHRFTSSALRKYNMTVPRGPTYGQFYIQCHRNNHGFVQDIDYIELNINSDDIIPFRISYIDIIQEIARQYGLFRITHQTYLNAGVDHPWPIEVGEVYGRAQDNSDATVAIADIWGQVTPAAYMVTSTGAPGATRANFWLTHFGVLPYSVGAIPITSLMDEDTWIDSHELGDLWVRVECKAGATGAIIKLLADEIVTKYTAPSWP